MVDGEIVAYDESGRPSFGRLQKRMLLSRPRDIAAAMARVPVRAVFFDCLALEGRDLRGLPLLQRKVGRVLVNAFPTGVEVCDAMVHGGPFPATSDGRSSSVGTAAIERFLRPVCYQNLPDALLPAALQAGNPWAIPRRTGGIPLSQALQEAPHGR